MFERVIVKTPSNSYVEGLTTSDLGTPNLEEALVQHEAYVRALRKCGVEVTHLQPNEQFPDSTFVEDTAVLTKEFAVITNPGTPSREKETVEMRPVIERFYQKVYTIESPAALDGGDVLQVENAFFIGISDRTNEAGAEQLKSILESEGYEATIIPLQQFFHLKTGISYVGKNQLVVAGEFIEHPAFASYDKIIIPQEDEYSANCIWVNDYVIIPAGYANTKAALEERGHQVIEVEMSEFRKQDGGLSCLSLRF